MNLFTNHRNQGSIPLEWVAVLGVLIIAAALALLVLFQDQPSELIIDSEFPIQFIGVRPDCGDAIYDAEGRLRRKEIYGLPDLRSWPTNTFRRNFIFELAATNLGRIIPRFYYKLKNPMMPSTGLKPAQLYRLSSGNLRIEIPAEIPSKYGRRFLYVFRRWVETSDLECELEFYVENARNQEALLSGPFTRSRELVLSDETKLRIDVESAEDLSGTEIIYTLKSAKSSLPRSFIHAILVRDLSGATISPKQTRINAQPGTQIMISQFPELKRSEIGEILIMKAQKVVIPDVRVDYPSLPERYYPASMDQVAHALGISNRLSDSFDLHNNVPDLATAVQLLDLVRGPHIQQLQTILLSQLKRLKQLNQATDWAESNMVKLRETALAWSQAADPRVRHAGITLGLTANWPEFVEPAMHMLVSDGPPYDLQTAQTLRNSAVLLSTNQIQTLHHLIRQSESASLIMRMVECLASNATETAKAALRDLSEDERPWIWGPVIRACPPSFWQDTPNLSSSTIKHLIQLHDSAPHASPALIREAYAGLPALLTVDLRTHDPHLFLILVKDRMTSPPLDKTVATRFLIEHLRNYPWPERDPFITWTMIQRINEWHGTTFGQEQRKAKAGSKGSTKVSWPDLVAQVLAWYQGQEK